MSTRMIAITSTMASTAARSRLLAVILRQIVGTRLAIAGPHGPSHRALSFGVVVPVYFAVYAAPLARDECGPVPATRGVGVDGVDHRIVLAALFHLLGHHLAEDEWKV